MSAVRDGARKILLLLFLEKADACFSPEATLLIPKSKR